MAAGRFPEEVQVRMLRAPIQRAVPGMTLALPLRHPGRPDRVLLKAGFVLDEPTIEKLRALGTPEVWVRFPGVEFIARHINPEVLRLQAQLTRSMGNAIETVGQGSGSPVRYADFEATMRRLLHELASSPQTGILMGDICCDDSVVLQHSMNVALLSLLMGLRLESYLVRERRRLTPPRAKDVVNLGVGALFHDIGLLRIDADALAAWKRTGEETPEWRRHAVLGYRQVRDHLDPTAAVVALQHHQAWDGSGFPKRRDADGEALPVAGSRIHVYSRIVAAADLFDRLRHPVTGGASLPRVRALRTMLEPDIQRRIDPMVFKGLLAVAPPYPPGMLVGLSSGEKAVVAGWSPVEPCRPCVRVIGDLDAAVRADEFNGPLVELRERDDLWIAEAEGEIVEQDNFTAAEAGDIDLEAAERALYNAAPPDDAADEAPSDEFADEAYTWDEAA
jgi:HD-GYP domain-containing protein (c-di-GMP phosphodiesterase class II)